MRYTPIPREEAASIIASIPRGRYFSVVFRKRGNGRLRRMLCQRGVRRHLRGGPSKYNPRDHQLLWVYDPTCGYRSIPYEGLRLLRYARTTYLVKG